MALPYMPLYVSRLRCWRTPSTITCEEDGGFRSSAASDVSIWRRGQATAARQSDR